MRNHVAKELWSGRFKSKIVRDRKKYTRKIKHKKGA